MYQLKGEYLGFFCGLRGRVNQIFPPLGQSQKKQIFITDMEPCYKTFTKEALKGIEIKENRFGFEPEITAKIAKKKLRICEVPFLTIDVATKMAKKLAG